jgi:hypothetical protein
MTVEQALAKIKALQVNALTRAAEVALVAVKPMIPISDGTGTAKTGQKPGGVLRNTTKIEAGDESVDLVSGGKTSGAEKYAAYQYATAERHAQGPGGLQPLARLASPQMRKGMRGQTAGQKYAAAYRYAVDMDLLQRFPGGVRWFKIILKDDQLQSKMMRVYARAMQ